MKIVDVYEPDTVGKLWALASYVQKGEQDTFTNDTGLSVTHYKKELDLSEAISVQVVYSDTGLYLESRVDDERQVGGFLDMESGEIKRLLDRRNGDTEIIPEIPPELERRELDPVSLVDTAYKRLIEEELSEINNRARQVDNLRGYVERNGSFNGEETLLVMEFEKGDVELVREEERLLVCYEYPDGKLLAGVDLDGEMHMWMDGRIDEYAGQELPRTFDDLRPDRLSEIEAEVWNFFDEAYIYTLLKGLAKTEPKLDVERDGVSLKGLAMNLASFDPMENFSQPEEE